MFALPKPSDYTGKLLPKYAMRHPEVSRETYGFNEKSMTAAQDRHACILGVHTLACLDRMARGCRQFLPVLREGRREHALLEVQEGALLSVLCCVGPEVSQGLVVVILCRIVCRVLLYCVGSQLSRE